MPNKWGVGEHWKNCLWDCIILLLDNQVNPSRQWGSESPFALRVYSRSWQKCVYD